MISLKKLVIILSTTIYKYIWRAFASILRIYITLKITGSVSQAS